jgi:competence protein ComEA
MKATLFAVLLSFFVSPLNTFAAANAPSKVSPPGTKALPPGISQKQQIIHLNQADVNTLTNSFKGIGRKRAESIIAYRGANGPFKSVDDLALVKGIGKQFVAKNQKQLQMIFSVQ